MAYELRGAKSPESQNRGMQFCPQCEGDMVQLVEWKSMGRTWTNHLMVTLRCPDCEWRDTGIFDEREVRAFDKFSEKATLDLAQTLILFTKDVMEDEADALADAMAADLISADDFRDMPRI